MSVKMRIHTERAQRVALFMDGAAEDFPADSKGGSLASSLKQELSNLSALAVARSAGLSKRQQGTAGRRGAREMLRELIQAVIDTARSAAPDRPDIVGAFVYSSKDRSDGALVATARAFALAAPPFVATLVDYGLPSTLIADLRALADSLEQNMSLQAEAAGAGVSTTANAEETYQRLAELVERLDPIVRNKYRSDPARLAAWDRARRLESAPQSKAKNNKTPPDTSDKG